MGRRQRTGRGEATVRASDARGSVAVRRSRSVSRPARTSRLGTFAARVAVVVAARVASRSSRKRNRRRRAPVRARKETNASRVLRLGTARVRIAVRVSFAPSYLLHARQINGFRDRQLTRGGHRPAFRLWHRDGRVTRGQCACGDKTYAETSIGVVGGSRNERRRVARADSAVTPTTASPSTCSDHNSVPYLVLHTRHLRLCPYHP